ncbi:hypothetical protein MMC17_007564 [Xylographa soralifera]|nr:hypothetical protein [Xylographa soralifera]
MFTDYIFEGRVFDVPFTESTFFLRSQLHQTFILGAIVVLANVLDCITGTVKLPISTVALKEDSLQAFCVSIVILFIVMMLEPHSVAILLLVGHPMVLYLALTLVTIGGIVCAVYFTPITVMAGGFIQCMIGGGIFALTDILTTNMTLPHELKKFSLLVSIIKATGTFMGFLVGGINAQGGAWR